MLTTCPDCSREVSARAPSCPGCGAPLAVTTTQRTGKPWKAAKLAAGLAVLVGLGLAFDHTSPQAAAVGPLVVGAGLLVWLAATVGAWWHHG